ncbi:uncharacterized protein LOC105180960 [Harpegnathos saltator]|nr:uncharacterized protein LOC105180960 [Harpegnathos saltator]
MKFALALLALVATASAKIEIPNFGRGELHKDIQEFLDLMPVDEIVAITLKYLSEDAEFQQIVEYLQGKEFKDLVSTVEALPEIKKLMDYIHHAGIDIYLMINKLNDRLGLPHLVPPKDLVLRNYATGGLRGYLDEIEAILPIEKIKALYEKKLKESKAFKDFVDQLKSKNFQEIVNKVYANPTVQKILKDLKARGVDLKLIRELLRLILGIVIPVPPRFCLFIANTMKFTLALFAVLAVIGLSQTHKLPNFGKGPLHEDIQDILDLVPMGEIVTVTLDYMSKDAQFQEVIEFLSTSTVLKDLTVDVEAIPEVINLLNFLQKEGVDIYFVINSINKAFGIKELVPPASNVYSMVPMKRTGGVAGYFKDIKKFFNYDSFIRIYVQKLDTSPAFGRFVRELKSNNFQQVVNKVYLSKPFQIIANGFKNYGVNLQIIADIMRIVLGITVPNTPQQSTFVFERTLIEELGDFMKLIPLDKFVDTAIEYFTKDQKVRSAFAYTLTSEFHELLRDVETLKEHQTVVIYLEKQGFHVIEGIQEFHKVIGMDKYVPPKIQNILKSQIGVQKVGDGMRAMFEDLGALVPTEKTQALYDEKMKTRNAFSEFVEKITSPEIKKDLCDLYAQSAHQKLLTNCMEHGLDLKAMSEFSRKLIPIPIPTPSKCVACQHKYRKMKLILALFAALAIIGLGQTYKLPDLGEDSLHEDVQKILDLYRQSVSGIGVPKTPQSNFVFERSLEEEMLDFMNLLPMEEFLQTLLEYITKDQKVQEALEYVFTPEFHDLLRSVEALKEFQNLVIYLEKSGLPVIEIIQKFHEAIGMEKYVPPKIDDTFESQIGVQKVGDGMGAMFKDLGDLVPTKKTQALYDEKMKTRNAFSDFVKVVTSAEMEKLLYNLATQPNYQKLVSTCLEHGLDFKAMREFSKKLIPIPIPIPSEDS